MARLLVTSGGPNAQSLNLKPGVNRVGRAPGNDLQIDHPSISSTHCEVELNQDTVTVRDRGSTNGTFIDNQPVTEAPLQPGQTLRLGAVEISLEASTASVSIPLLNRPVTSALPPGATPCHHHTADFGTRKCLKCHKVFCEICVHVIKRVGGRPLVLCPMCSGHTELFDGTGRPKKKSFFAGLLDALKKPFQRPSR